MRVPTRSALVILLVTMAATDAQAQIKEKNSPDIPKVQNKSWPRSGIDAFVLARIEAKGLKPSPEASRYAQARRASLTLTGLPPSLDQLDRFVTDKMPNAYETMIDRLLASKAHRDYWKIIMVHHEKPAEVKASAQAASWARVVWQQVFGQKLNPASHPRLKDHLVTLVQTAGDKRFLRLLLTSATYRQSSEMRPDLHKNDRHNEWFARYPRSKLPTWVINGSILFLSGLSNEDGKLLSDRQLKPQPKRNAKSSSPPSALILLSAQPWVMKSSAAIARQVLIRGGKTDDERFAYATSLVLGRRPSKQETAKVAEFILQLQKKHAKDATLSRRMKKLEIEFPGTLIEAAVWTDLSWVLINTQEFAYKQ